MRDLQQLLGLLARQLRDVGDPLSAGSRVSAGSRESCRLPVVVEQIYYRWKQGLTQDPRFAGFIHGVGRLCGIAAAAIEKRSL